ncbi:GNAT family N-acetyltransferase [Kineococcus sp. SYSU DK006]|uniref:GNAT family N-acetyltransferase n=1 Tax=Kineococcus sp. SYSU DK006 TaxID=3383127 RepID=UPI003D7CDF38
MPGSVWSFPAPLVSERLLLRGHREEDLDDLVAFHGDEEVTRHTPWPTRTRAQTREALLHRTGQQAAACAGEAIVLAVQEQSSGTVVGEVLLLRQGDDEAVLGYALRRDRWGRGLATEAARTLLEAGIDRFGLRRITAVVVPENVASTAVLAKLGFVEVARSPERITFARAVER